MIQERAILGTWGSLWIDGDEIGEVTEVHAKVESQKIDIKMAKHMTLGHKNAGWNGTGSFKVNKVSSYFITKFAPGIKEGKQVTFTLISKVADPDAFGAERIALYNCVVDDVNLINWAVGEVGEEEFNFTFTDYEFLDTCDEA